MPDFEAIRERHNRIVDADAALVHAEWFERYQQLLDTADDFGRLLMDQEDLRDDDEP